MPGAAQENNGEKSMPPFAIGLLVIVFIGSGVCQPLISAQISYAGLGSKTAQLYMLPYYFGMACVGFLYCCLPSKRWCEYKIGKSMAISIVDIIGQTLNYTGNNMAGSGLFAVIYASVSIWCGVLSWAVGLRKLTMLQWLAILVVFGGLAIAAVDATSSGSQVLLGSILIIIGSILHAVMYVASEFVAVRGGDEKIPPHINCSSMAIMSTLAFFVWNMCYTVPHWEAEIAHPMEVAGTTPEMVYLLFAGTAFFNFVHSASFFFLLKWLGAVSCAVMKAVQAVLVFVIADPLYCRKHSDQCTTTARWISLAVVVAGVLCYVVVTQRAQKQAVVASQTATAADALMSLEGQDTKVEKDSARV